MPQESTTGNIKKYCAEAFGYLRETAKFPLIALVVFMLGIWIGLLYPSHGEGLLSAMKTMARQLAGRSALQIAGTIFLKNSLSAATSVVLGPLLGIVPVLGAAGNGLMLGTLLSHTSEANRINMLLRLVPHGIFELPAMFIAWGAGLWQGAWPFNRSEGETFRERRRKAFRILLVVILPLLLVASVIEGLSITLATR